MHLINLYLMQCLKYQNQFCLLSPRSRLPGLQPVGGLTAQTQEQSLQRKYCYLAGPKSTRCRPSTHLLQLISFTVSVQENLKHVLYPRVCGVLHTELRREEGVGKKAGRGPRHSSRLHIKFISINSFLSPSIIHSFNKHLLNNYYESDTV